MTTKKEQAKAISLYKAAGYKEREIADKMGMTYHQLRNLIHNLRAQGYIVEKGIHAVMTKAERLEVQRLIDDKREREKTARRNNSVYSDEEIRIMIRDAADPQYQVKICAELTEMKKSEIVEIARDILQKRGVHVN